MQLVILEFVLEETAWEALLLRVRTIELWKLHSFFRNHWIPIGEVQTLSLHLCINHAAKRGHLEVVRLLLEAGADQNAAMQDRETALMVAAVKAVKGHLEVAQVLRVEVAHEFGALRCAIYKLV